VISSFRAFATVTLVRSCSADGIAIVEIALHTLLCIRQLYGTNTFVRKRAHGVPVYQSRHPAVKEYIAGVVKALHVELCEVCLRQMGCAY
jgi:mitotic spindle assembly checkpoint protein MAD2B